MDIVLATTNKGKIAELTGALSRFGVNVIGLDQFPHIGEIQETGQTFSENALIKATEVCRLAGMTALADDSGLVVEALDGAPGVFSARFADDWPAMPHETRDERNIRKLLKLMEDIPQERRQCHFVTSMAAVAPNGATLETRGQWEGTLLLSPIGLNGFGYDPVFWDNDLGRSAAQLTREEKNSRSHRGKALEKLMASWPQFLQAASK